MIRVRCIVWIWAPDDEAADEVLREIPRLSCGRDDVHVHAQEESRDCC